MSTTSHWASDRHGHAESVRSSFRRAFGGSLGLVGDYYRLVVADTGLAADALARCLIFLIASALAALVSVLALVMLATIALTQSGLSLLSSVAIIAFVFIALTIAALWKIRVYWAKARFKATRRQLDRLFDANGNDDE